MKEETIKDERKIKTASNEGNKLEKRQRK